MTGVAALFPRNALIEAGHLLYGEDWQRPIARALGPHYPSAPRAAIDDRLVRRWAAGERDVPAWVIAALPAMLSEAAVANDDRAARCRELAAGLTRVPAPAR